jgi:prepilin-type N-terminal cleavage/methylation domain-containing protein
MKKNGFTILESIVAIAILSLSISGVFSAVQQSLAQSTISKEEVQAFYLAQEAVEIIRNKRDSNQLAVINGTPASWLSGIAENADDPCYFGKTCEVDATGPSNKYLFSCSGSWNSCDNLKQDTDTFLFNYATGNTTHFKREIQIEQMNANEVAIIVRISWDNGGSSREFKIKTLLFNWL